MANHIEQFNLKPKRYSSKFNSDMYVTLYTDASFDVQHRVTGIAFYVRHKDIKFYGAAAGVKESITGSNAAEEHAIWCGIEWIKSKIDCKGKVLTISSDCIGALGKVDVEALIHELKFAKVFLKHTKGHTDGGHPRTYINNQLDRMARAKMRDCRNTIVLNSV